MLTDNLDAASRGHVDDFSVACVAWRLRTRLRTVAANQLFANRLPNLLRQGASPSSRLRVLPDSRFGDTRCARDLTNGKLAGAVLAVDRFPIHALAFGHVR